MASTQHGVATCGMCGNVKPASYFYGQGQSPNWLSSYCKPCHVARSGANAARRKAKEPERFNAQKVKHARTWQKKNPEKWSKQNKKNLLKFTHGITPEQYHAMVKAQGDKCALCKSTHKGPKAWKYWPIDHCHKSGRIRGLLCFLCNTRLGAYEKLKDTIGLAEVEMYLNGRVS